MRSRSSASRRRPARPIAVAGNAHGDGHVGRRRRRTARPIDDYELRIDGGEPRSRSARHRLHVDRPDQRRSRCRSACGPTTAPAGDRGAVRRRPSRPTSSPARPAAPTVQFADGALTRDVGAAGQRGQRDHELRHPDRRRRLGHPARRHRDHVPLGGPAQRPGVHVPGARRERQGRGRVQLAVGARAPAAPARRPAGAGRRARATRRSTSRWGAPGNGGDPIIEYQVQLVSTAPSTRTTGTSMRWSNLPNGQAQQFQVRARNRADWGAWSPASAAVVPCGVPDAPAGVAAQRGDGVGHGDVDRAERPGLRDRRLHDHRQRRPARRTSAAAQTSTTVRRADATARATRSPSSPATRSARARRSAALQRRRSRPAPRARRRSRRRRPTPGGSPRLERGERQRRRRSRRYQLRVNGGGWENVGNRHVVHPRRARQQHDVHVPGARPSTTSDRARRQHRERPRRRASRIRSASA